jgi:hypothetical protein
MCFIHVFKVLLQYDTESDNELGSDIIAFYCILLGRAVA